MKAAGINPSEAVIGTGALAELFPSTFPSGQGSDLAGVIERPAPGSADSPPVMRGRPLQVVDDQQRGVVRGLLEGLLQLAQQPEALVW